MEYKREIQLTFLDSNLIISGKINMKKELSEHEAKLYSPVSLAFLGDSVYELWIRNKILLQANMPSEKIHEIKVKYVCAEYQAEAADRLFEILTEDEKAVFMRGRNAKGISYPKHGTKSEYRKATGLEAVLGYLYLTGNVERTEYLMNVITE